MSVLADHHQIPLLQGRKDVQPVRIARRLPLDTICFFLDILGWLRAWNFVAAERLA